MADFYTEICSEGWFSRIGGSINGILFGLVAIPMCVILLWWNEGRAVTAAIVAVAADKVNAANDKKLIRHIEIYQWVENKKVEKKEYVGGSEETKTA
ncbi:MAG: hypothetical protein IPK22_25340 [Verrucomicrobiaceae bacterium]|nr:hypothetical protein [Verrucomicrobiaceae bacterium]